MTMNRNKCTTETKNYYRHTYITETKQIRDTKLCRDIKAPQRDMNVLQRATKVPQRDIKISQKGTEVPLRDTVSLSISIPQQMEEKFEGNKKKSLDLKELFKHNNSDLTED